jgi:hypothetical protein
MKLKAAVIVALVLLALAAGEAKAQKVEITNINTTVSKQITVTVKITNGPGWLIKPSGCDVQLRPPGGAAGAGVFGSASATSMDNLNWTITFTNLTARTRYDVQAIGHLRDTKNQERIYYSGTSNTTVPP